ncbi:UNVERIFIED_CONTAM: hypothetical protein Slati_1324300 [Sesamum latifolium]|uniref:Reverse transcriptase zinc-binding domain-containing protein n=1 Tax=Sesamum latifolium TaxID=2727402 RepID=A0AAW2XH19_9LAMI
MSDPWLIRPSTFRPLLPPVSLEEGSLVNYLLQEDDTSWNEGLVRKEFSELDATAILQVPVQGSGTEDGLVWHYGAQGRFSVKSAYDLAVQQQCSAGSSGESESANRCWKNWSFLWKARVPPKVSLFAWRACSDAIPVNRNLGRRGCKISAECSRCSFEVEDAFHVLMKCTYARQTWAVSHLSWGIISLTAENVEIWMRNARREQEAKQFEIFILVCWSLWNSRNQLLFENELVSPLEVVR